MKKRRRKAEHICHCGGTKWQTKVKGKIYQCRKCGYLRQENNEN